MNNLFIVTLLLSLTGIAYGLRCYDCIWNEDNLIGSEKNCQNKKDLKDSLLRTCPGTYREESENSIMRAFGKNGADTRAVKQLCIKVDVKHKNKKQIERKCIEYYDRASGTCETRPDYFDFTDLRGCYCDKDKCNGSSSLTAGFALTMILTIGKLLF